MKLLVEKAHPFADQFSKMQKQGNLTALEKLQPSLAANVSDLITMLDILDETREQWWNDPKKSKQRKEWTETYQESKLVALQKVNNKTKETIDAMRARLGVCTKWTMGVAGGLEEIKETEGKMEVHIETR